MHRFLIIMAMLIGVAFGATAPQTTISVRDGNGLPQTVNTQPQVGTAGSPATDVLTVQGNASGTPLPIAEYDFAANGNITVVNSNLNSGAATAGSTVMVGPLSGEGTLAIQVSGTWTGTLIAQGTIDNTNWVSLGSVTNIATGAQSANIASASTGIWQVTCGGMYYVRVTASAAVTGTAVVSVRVASQTDLVALDAPLPAGTNLVGGVNQAQVSGTAVSVNAGTKDAGTQRVTLATDQTAITTAGVFSVKTDQTTHGTTDYVAADITKMNGVAVSMGSGVNGTGVQRVTLATDQAACSVAGLFSVKTDQTTHGTTDKTAADLYCAAAAVPGNNGTATANCPRVVIASDNTANSNPWLVKGNISDNATPAATSNLPCLTARYDSATNGVTSGNMGFFGMDISRAVMTSGNSNKQSFSYTLNSIAATTGTWNAFSIEQGGAASKTIYIKRFVIWNVGKFTTAQTTIVQMLRQTTAASTGDGAMTPLVHDTADTATATGRYGNVTSVTAGTTGAAADTFCFWSPTATATHQPIVIDLTNGGMMKGVVIAKTNNAGILVRIIGAAGGSDISMSVQWTEEGP